MLAGGNLRVGELSSGTATTTAIAIAAGTRNLVSVVSAVDETTNVVLLVVVEVNLVRVNVHTVVAKPIDDVIDCPLLDALSTSHDFGSPDWRWASLNIPTDVVLRLHEAIQNATLDGIWSTGCSGRDHAEVAAAASFRLLDSERQIRQDQRASVVSPVRHVVVSFGTRAVIPPLLGSERTVHIKDAKAIRNLWSFRAFLALWRRGGWRSRSDIHIVKIFCLPLDVAVMTPRVPVAQVLQFSLAPVRADTILGVETCTLGVPIALTSTLQTLCVYMARVRLAVESVGTASPEFNPASCTFLSFMDSVPWDLRPLAWILHVLVQALVLVEVCTEGSGC
jgi:hypothetical protein